MVELVGGRPAWSIRKSNPSGPPSRRSARRDKPARGNGVACWHQPTKAWPKTDRVSRRARRARALSAFRYETVERVEIIRIEYGKFDVLVGINLLRRAWTCAVSLVAILDATKKASCARPAADQTTAVPRESARQGICMQRVTPRCRRDRRDRPAPQSSEYNASTDRAEIVDKPIVEIMEGARSDPSEKKRPRQSRGSRRGARDSLRGTAQLAER